MRCLVLTHGTRIQIKRVPAAIHTQFKSRLALSDRFETKFVKWFYTETRDTVWFLVDKLRNAKRRLPLSHAAFSHGVSQEDLFSFNDIVFAKDLDTALSNLRERGFVTTDMDVKNGRRLLPTWLVLFLVTQKVQTRSQTSPMLDMVSSHLDATPFHLRPSLLVMATLALARFNILSSLRHVVQTFLIIPLSYPTLQFNLLLRAISRFPSSIEAADQVVAVLTAMESRQIPLQSRTYDALLCDRFVTLQLVKTLRARMIQDGFVPTAAHLEAYLRIFAKNGAIHDAKRYHDAIHALAVNKKGPKGRRNANPDSSEPYSSPRDSSTRTADTLYLGAFHNDRASAFRFLANLLKSDKEEEGIINSNNHYLRPSHIPRFGLSSSKQGVDVRDWTTALAVAARDKTTSSQVLISLFQNALVKTTNFRPTIATYTVIIRGLLHRKDYLEAVCFWNKLLHEPFVLDRKALAVGLQVLTRARKPSVAFETLEYFAAKPNIDGSVPSSLPNHTSCPAHRAITLNTIVINEFMISLIRIGRPDIIFKLWDHMETLYGVSSDAVTFNILLKAARLSAKLDDSFTGAFAQLASKNPFRRLLAGPPRHRQDIVSAIQQMMVDENGRPRAYATLMWNGFPAWQWVIKIFHQVVLGNWPGLSTVRPPAKVIRVSGRVNTLHSWSDTTLTPNLGDQSQDSAVRSRPLYPQIYPTDATFFAYIQLLGVQSLATEIPLALAWMRALEIEPSTDTLALALVFWAEVSLHGPLIENLVGEKSEYAKLVRWMRDWVGDEKAPNDEDVRRWLRIMATIRAGR